MKNFLVPAIAALFLSASVSAQSTVDSIEAKYKLLPMPAGLTLEKAFPVLGTYQLNAPGTVGSTTTSTTTNSSTSATSSTTTTSDNTNSSSPATANGSAGTVVITMDSSSKGIVWVDGLPEGRMKAYLKKSPATYRIVPQTTSTGKVISEGTLVYNPDNNTLNISIGAPYNEADPTAIFNTANSNNDVAAAPMPASGTGKVKVKTKTANSKTKNRVMFYSASKSLTNSSSNAAQQ